VYAGGIEEVVSCTRAAQREAMVPPRALVLSRSSRVTSEFGAPPVGVMPWQLMHLAREHARDIARHAGHVARAPPPPLPPPLPARCSDR